MGISDVGAGQVCYTSHLTTQKEKQRAECDYCGTYFASVQTMKRHQRMHTRSGAQILRKFKCEFCPKRFNKCHNLKSHRRIHTGEKPFQCEFCSKKFNRSDNLRLHVRVHTGEKPFQCEFCPKRFNQSQHLKRHCRIHTGEKPFQCEFCSKKFYRSDNLRLHVRVHTGEKPFQCEFCPKRFKTSYNLQSHRRIHTGKKPYKCTPCHKQFASHAGLKYHLKSHAKSLAKSQNLEKTENGDTYKIDNTTLEVLNTDATADATADTVIIDGDEIIAPRTMTGIAEGTKPPQLEETPNLSVAGYHCEHCSKVCKSVAGLTNHQRSHFIHKCQFCGKVFLDTNTLEDHFSEHHPEQEKLTHRCSDSLKCFPTVIALRGHMESSHSNQKECMCEWCGRMFGKSYLPEHYRIHQQIPHKCEFCGKIFTAPSYLRRHIKRCHKH